MLSKKITISILLLLIVSNVKLVIAAGDAVGKIDATFAVNPVTGAATYAIPIKVPAGIGGLQPKLSLNYNSQAGSGLLGIGWTLSGATSVITKCSKNYAQDGKIQGPFDQKGVIEKLCLDGQKLVNTNGAYGIEGTEYRTEIESDVFVKQNARPNFVALNLTASPAIDFTVSAKSGLTRQYGFAAYMNAPSRFNYVVAQQWLSAWALTTTSDVFGNRVKHSYLPNSESSVTLPDGSSVISDIFHPMAIDYSFLKTTNVPKLSVYIEYEARPDLNFVNVVGMISGVNKRVKSITVYRTNWSQSDYNTAGTNAGRVNLYASNLATPIKKIHSLLQ